MTRRFGHSIAWNAAGGPGTAARGVSRDARTSFTIVVLRGVSRGMRDAVDATGRKVEETREEDAAERGYVSTLKCLRRRGRLRNESRPWAAAASRGDLEELKALRAKKFLDVRVRGLGRPPRGAKVGARERLPVGRVDVLGRGEGRACRDSEVGARERLPVGRGDVCARGGRWPPRGAAVGARERLPVGRSHALPTRASCGIRRNLSDRRETACAFIRT